ncbi:fumarylacetoacetate hydrolase family protein [Phyllobacterium sp. SB3]|uniref:fumarylacetoacetate hydrolase family protein n=1 Tax=Phyllobacterium sp. SB3 TaxID=3156073 RepID=UPI0032AF2B17
MRLVKFTADGRTRLGTLSDGKIVELSGFTDMAETLDSGNLERLRAPESQGGNSFDPDKVTYEAPLGENVRVFCVGINFLKKHPIAGVISKAPERPTIFLKLVETFVGHEQTLEHPGEVSQNLDYEGELAVVIGRGGRHILEEEAYSHVFGYTLLNDGSVRDWQKHSLVSGKNFYHSSSCGPYVVTADEVSDPMKLDLVTRWNDEEVQNANMDLMLFDIPYIISHISQFTTLKPGDIIATGTPSGSGGSMDPQRFLRPGDKIEIEISELGMLSNTVG